MEKGVTYESKVLLVYIQRVFSKIENSIGLEAYGAIHIFINPNAVAVYKEHCLNCLFLRMYTIIKLPVSITYILFLRTKN